MNVRMAEFDSEILLNSHFSIHTNVIKCEICDLRFLSKQELWKHWDKDHEWKQLHKCRLCSAEFDSKIR